jgi:hypothetical protein
MDGFTINRSLCEVEFFDKYYDRKNMMGIDVDVMEYVWVKIREHWLINHKCEPPTLNNFVEIGFCEIKKYIGKHSKTRLTDSVKGLDSINIETNQKSTDPSECYHFTFSISENEKSFKVDFDNDIFKLIDKPQKFCEYNQSDLFQFKEKHTKLLFKFLIGYKKLAVMKTKFFIEYDVLIKILNVHPKISKKTNEPMTKSKIQYDIFKSSFKKISENTDLDVELIKTTSKFENGIENFRYIVKFNGYEETEVEEVEKEHKVDTLLKDVKDHYKDKVKDNGMVPFFYITHIGDDDLYYVDDSYKLVGVHNGERTKSESETHKLIKSWDDSKKLQYKVEYLDNIPEFLKRQCI